MKTHRFKFPAPLTPEQERCLYAGFSAFYYQVEDGFSKGINQADNRLYRAASNAMKRVTNVDGAEMALDRLRMVKDKLENLMGWKRIEPGIYEFWLNTEYFNKAMNLAPGPMAANLGDKLDRKLLDMFDKQILPKIGLKRDDVVLISEVTENGSTETGNPAG